MEQTNKQIDFDDLYFRNSFNQKTYKDANIYRSLNIFIEEYIKAFLKFQKDIKNTLGRDIVNKLIESISYLRKSLENKDKTKKLEYALECRELLEDIKIYIKFLEIPEFNSLSEKKYIHLMELLGKTQYQLKNWINSLSK